MQSCKRRRHRRTIRDGDDFYLLSEARSLKRSIQVWTNDWQRGAGEAADVDAAGAALEYWTSGVTGTDGERAIDAARQKRVLRLVGLVEIGMTGTGPKEIKEVSLRDELLTDCKRWCVRDKGLIEETLWFSSW